MTAPHRFVNREQAGQLLAQRLHAYAGCKDAVVLALPRGGLPLGFAVASELALPLDILLVRKLGLPGHEEFAMGAIASGGLRFLQEDIVDIYAIPASAIEAIVQRETLELSRRENVYRAGRPALSLQKRVVILVDDGLATGATMKVAVLALRKADPARVIIAVPVASAEAINTLKSDVDEIICLMTPDPFYAVSAWYEHFEQTSDEEVIRLLDLKARNDKTRTPMPTPTPTPTHS